MESEASKIIRMFGTRIRQLRYAQGWKQVDLAAALDWKITRSAISYIENGKKSPSVETLIDLSNVFGIEPAALLLQPWTNPKHSAANAILGCPAGSNYCCIQSICINCHSSHQGVAGNRRRPAVAAADDLEDLEEDLIALAGK